MIDRQSMSQHTLMISKPRSLQSNVTLLKIIVLCFNTNPTQFLKTASENQHFLMKIIQDAFLLSYNISGHSMIVLFKQNANISTTPQSIQKIYSSEVRIPQSCYMTPFIQLLISYMSEQTHDYQGSQAIFDICLTIGSIKNVTDQWTPSFSLDLRFQIMNSDCEPSPYQIIHSHKTWDSSIDINCYKTGAVVLGPFQQKEIKEICLFRSSVPIDKLEEKLISCYVDFRVQSQFIGTVGFDFEACIGLNSYLPIFAPSLGLVISAKLETQLLGIRVHKNCETDSTLTLYRALDNIFDEGNRLTHKIKMFDNQKLEMKIMAELQRMLISQSTDDISEDRNELYNEFSKLKQFKSSRIFRHKQSKDHRVEIVSFLSKVNNEFMSNLKFNWHQYLKLSVKQSTKQMEILRNKFVENFAIEVKNKIIRNNGLMNKSNCPILIDNLKLQIHGFEIRSIKEETEQQAQLRKSSFVVDQSGRHVIVLVHGLGANSLAMALIERNIYHLYPHAIVLNSRSNQIPEQNANIEKMGRNLAIQIQQLILNLDDPSEYEISFISHSLGGVVARAALLHMETFKLNMNSFISLSTPHLGHISHENLLAKLGMIAINKIEQSNVIDDLLLKDHEDQRLSFVYGLSTHTGLSWFKSVIFYGCSVDGYVSCNSALIDSRKQAKSKNPIFAEMAKNLSEILKTTNVEKYEVKFEHEKQGYKPDLAEMLVGRASHLAFPTHQSFINFLLLHNYKYFKADDPQEESLIDQLAGQ